MIQKYVKLKNHSDNGPQIVLFCLKQRTSLIGIALKHRSYTHTGSLMVGQHKKNFMFT